MGLIVDKPELLAALDQSDHDIRSQQAEARRAMSALNSLAGDASLDGRGWQAAKRHAADAAKPRLEAAVRQGDRVMADNAEFRQRLESLIADDYLDEDGIADCVARIRRNDSLLRQARDLLPADGGPLKVLIDRMRQQGEQQAARLEDKIRRLHTLDQTTRHLYQDTTPPTGNNSDTVMDEVVNGDMDQEQLTAFFEKTMHLSHEDAAALAEFTSRFRDYAKKTHLTDKEAVDSYAIILASTSYGGAMWTTAAGTLTNKQLVALLGLMGYKDGKGPGSAQYFISQMFNMHKTDGKNRDSIDFIHEMASLACILNTAPGGLIYHLSGTDVEDQPQFRLHGPLFDKYPWLNSEADDRSDEIATWSGDIASGAGGRADWNADMDAVNIHRAMKANPKESPRKAADDYYTSIGRGDTERNRARRFCAGYDPTGSNDPQKGLKWLEDNAAYLSTASPGAHLLKDRFQATTDQQDKAREDFLSTLRQEIK